MLGQGRAGWERVLTGDARPDWIQGHPLGRKFKALVCHDGSFSTLSQWYVFLHPLPWGTPPATTASWLTRPAPFPVPQVHRGTLLPHPRLRGHALGQPGRLREVGPGTLRRRVADAAAGASNKPYISLSTSPPDPRPLRAARPGSLRPPSQIIHGELDYRLPITEGLAPFNVLQARGVPSKLVVFPDENHVSTSHLFLFLLPAHPPRSPLPPLHDLLPSYMGRRRGRRRKRKQNKKAQVAGFVFSLTHSLTHSSFAPTRSGSSSTRTRSSGTARSSTGSTGIPARRGQSRGRTQGRR